MQEVLLGGNALFEIQIERTHVELTHVLDGQVFVEDISKRRSTVLATFVGCTMLTYLGWLMSLG